MERRATDTMPLPVVEAAPGAGAAPTAAMPAEPPLPPPPPPAPPRRDLTPWLLGLLAVGALLALVLSAMALSGDDRPPAAEPAGADAATTTLVPAPTFAPPAPPSSVQPSTVPTVVSPRTTATPRATAAPVLEPDSKPGRDKDDDGDEGKGKGKD